MRHGDLGLDGVVFGYSLDDAWLPPFPTSFFFSFPFFFFSVTWFLVLLVSPSEEGGEGETNEVEGGGATTGRLIVSPRRDNVAMCGAPTSPQEEKGLGFPPRGDP